MVICYASLLWRTDAALLTKKSVLMHLNPIAIWALLSDSASKLYGVVSTQLFHNCLSLGVLFRLKRICRHSRAFWHE